MLVRKLAVLAALVVVGAGLVGVGAAGCGGGGSSFRQQLTGAATPLHDLPGSPAVLGFTVR